LYGGWQKPWNNKDIIFLSEREKCCCLLIECKGYNRRKKVVFASDVLSLGRDALIVNDADDVRDLKKFCTDRNLRIKGISWTSHIHKKWGRPGNGKGRIV